MTDIEALQEVANGFVQVEAEIDGISEAFTAEMSALRDYAERARQDLVRAVDQARRIANALRVAGGERPLHSVGEPFPPVPLALVGSEAAARPSDDELLAGFRLAQQRRGLSPKTIYVRERCIKSFMERLDRKSILEASQADVEFHLDDVGVGNRARGTYLSHYASFYRWAVKAGFIPSDPTAEIEAPKKRVGVPKPMTDSDLGKMLRLADCFADDLPGRQRRCFLVLGLFAGLRAQEIAGLCSEDVDLDNGAIVVRNGKGGKDRAVPLHPEIRAELEALPMPSRGVVFRQRDGSPLNPHNVSHAVGRYFARNGISGSCHSLRHTFATKLYRSTQDILLTQKLLGHSSPTVTQVYAEADMTRAAPAVNALSIDRT